MKKAIFFDLDGTLTDSGEGIINCAALALEHFGLPVPSREEMRVFVGPPLDQTFIKFGVPADKTKEAIDVFRSRYVVVGKFENFPYPGIHQVLQNLKEQGHRLFVATSKPEVFSVRILERFGLDKYFEVISGAMLHPPKGYGKADVIREALKRANISDLDGVVMVGDRKHDIIGAHTVGIPAIGVLYGYGDREEHASCGADHIVESVSELKELLR